MTHEIPPPSSPAAEARVSPITAIPAHSNPWDALKDSALVAGTVTLQVMTPEWPHGYTLTILLAVAGVRFADVIGLLKRNRSAVGLGVSLLFTAATWTAHKAPWLAGPLLTVIGRGSRHV